MFIECEKYTFIKKKMSITQRLEHIKTHVTICGIHSMKSISR